MKKNSLPTVFVILGATGDLMRQKLAPALFHLSQQGNLPPLFQIIGFSKDELSREEFQGLVRETVKAKVQAPEGEIAKFSQAFVYQAGFFEEREGYEALAEFLGRKDKEWQMCSNKLFYIASSPQRYQVIFKNLAASGLTKPCTPIVAQRPNSPNVEVIRDKQGVPLSGWTRVIVEKPFGKDLKTAQELDTLLGKLFKEEQIYRVDHYLGKETVQNILAFRFSNSFLQDSWNNKGIERVSIRLFEKEGVGSRGAFYDGLGALRDVGQNHILQLLALFVMQTPATFEGDSIRAERAKVMGALAPMSAKDVEGLTKRGQYQGYTKEENVDPHSQTETYFRLQTSLNNNTWKGVPIVLESGKGMGQDLVEVEVVFKHPTPCLCPPGVGKHYHNILHYYIQPREGIAMSVWVKKPGPAMSIEEKEFSFDYREAFQGEEFADAYERLLLSIIQGDQTLFVSTEEIMASWKFVDSVVRGWKKQNTPLVQYPKGAFLVET